MLVTSIFSFSKNVFYAFSPFPKESLPNDKVLDCSKLKAFSDDKIQVLKIIIFDFDRIENNVGKGENAGYQHFLHFPQCFQRAFNFRSLKVEIVSYRVTKQISYFTSHLFCCLQKFPICTSLKFSLFGTGLTLYQTTKFLAWSKLKAFADDKIDAVKMMISLIDRLENTGGIGENAGNQHFLLFPQCFPNPSSIGSLKVCIVWKRVNPLPHNPDFSQL